MFGQVSFVSCAMHKHVHVFFNLFQHTQQPGGMSKTKNKTTHRVFLVIIAADDGGFSDNTGHCGVSE